MPLPKSLVQPFRRGQLVVGGGWRAYFANFNVAAAVTQTSTSIGPTILDLQQGKFIDATLPSGWFDLGWLSSFKITPKSKIGMVRSGFRGAVRAMYRGEVGEEFEVKFREMSRMSYKLATGCEIFNLLVNASGPSTAGPLSASGTTAVAMGASGYQALGITATPTAGLPTLFMPAGSGSLFPAGTYIVADQDYTVGQFGFVGDSGVPLFQGATTDIDFVRKTSDYVARVSQVIPGVAGQDALVLNRAFVGGGNAVLGTPNTAPTVGAKVQAIRGYSAREGGTQTAEWSALFLMDTIDGSQIAIYYPHVAPNAFKDIAGWTLENAGTTSLTGYELDTVFEALAFDDPLDGETVVRYSAYYPARNLDPQI